MTLLMLCGCSGGNIGEVQLTENTSISISEETESLPEITSETEAEEITSAEINEEETTSETEAEEITSTEKIEKTEETTSETEKAVQKYYFRSEKLFNSHYEKHGAEFGDITQEEYLELANELINAEGDNILHKTEKEDGDYLYYDTETNEFLVLSTDGYIRTFLNRAQAWTTGNVNNAYTRRNGNEICMQMLRLCGNGHR